MQCAPGPRLRVLCCRLRARTLRFQSLPEGRSPVLSVTDGQCSDKTQLLPDPSVRRTRKSGGLQAAPPHLHRSVPKGLFTEDVPETQLVL